VGSKRAVGKLAGEAAEGLMRPLAKVVKQGEELPALVKKVVRDSKGREIPEGVKRLPSGRLPANFEHAGNQFPMEKLPAKLQQKYPSGVQFTEDGFPDFSPYATHTVKFEPPGFAGNHGSDFTDANRLANIESAPRTHTWHHHQDGQTMQLIPKDLHSAVRHAGGVAIAKGRQ